MSEKPIGWLVSTTSNTTLHSNDTRIVAVLTAEPQAALIAVSELFGGEVQIGNPINAQMAEQWKLEPGVPKEIFGLKSGHKVN